MHVFEKNTNIFHLLSEAVTEGILVVDEQQRIVSINGKAAALFGYIKKELMQKSLSLLIPDHFTEAHKSHVKHFLCNKREDGELKANCTLGKRKAGDTFPLELTFHPFQVYGKNYVLALIQDKSETEEIIQNLHLKEDALDATLNGITITDASKKGHPIVYVNKAFINLTGYNESEILDRNCTFLQKNKTHDKGFRVMLKAMALGKKCRVQVKNVKKDGTAFWNEVSINPIKNKKGEITHYVGVHNDISHKKKAEEEIRHFLKIFEDSLNEIFVFDANSLCFTHANYGAIKNTGYSLKMLKKLKITDLFVNGFEKQLRDKLDLILDSSQRKLVFETRIQRKNGSIYPVEVHLQTSSLHSTKVVVAMVLDISERKNYTEELERKVKDRTKELKSSLEKEKELSELKTKFLSMVSHEFKTPLSTILTSATLVSKYTEKEQQEKREKHLKTISAGVQRLTDILNDFLSIERIEKGKQFYNCTRFSLSKVVNEVLYNANMFLKTGQNIKYPMHIEDVSIYQDERIVSLILTNLIHNAIKYSPENTNIILKITIQEKTMQMRVIDSGLGIPEKDQKHIFDRYFRADNVLLTQGTGIGLNIVHSHVTKLGGNISFKSVENKGTEFTVELPISQREIVSV
ncbi:PAS domain S-box protein [Eudoraea chungangensis]|uniref:sensor histidine kinase n=1 Tax=Eudoraea chungangensis TaxID=1481905 RepID=UPI0023ECC78A|nr:PAS domain S-box protein [Eudoraea chungangensis]